MERSRIPQKQTELVEEFDAMDEAELIVEQGFGYDYIKDLTRLNQERIHAEGCGCGQCRRNYEAHVMDAVWKYSKEEPSYSGTIYDSKHGKIHPS